MMTYAEALQYLRDLEPRGWRLGLERMSAFCERAALADVFGANGAPGYIHVAGTNGKGSVTAFAQSMLQAAGHRTGAFFSPYVVDPRERVWYGGEMISETEFASAVQALKPIAESLDTTEFGGVTEFEFKTAVGFLHWKRQAAEWVAIEVGLGGRFDSTNVITPKASVIVSIGLDHVKILGDTFAKIAFEKAGIIKPRVPVVVGELPPEALEVVLQVANEREAPALVLGREFHLERSDDDAWVASTPSGSVELRPSLYGDVQGHNAALAYVAMEASGAGSGQIIADAASRASLPGRFQRETVAGRRIILDGAHNAPAAAILAAALKHYRERYGFDRLLVVAGMVSGHEPATFFEPLASVADEFHLAPIDFHRAIPPAELRSSIDGVVPVAGVHKTVGEAIDCAIGCSGPSDLVLVTGSFYLVGDAIRVLRGRAPG